jgi:multisubunit Na+/H+ antiporter MnhF subunit
MERLVALEYAGLLTALTVVLFAEGFARVSLYDLALGLVLLSFSSTLVFAYFLERWL